CYPGEIIDVQIDSIVYNFPYWRYICIGWTGSGGITPTSGTDNSATVTITDTADMQWQWLEQYYLTLGAIGGADAPTGLTGEDWYFADSTANIHCDSEIIGTEGNHYFFNLWNSDPTDAIFDDEYANTTDVLMNQPYTVYANYDKGVKLTVSKSPIHSEGWISIQGSSYSGVDSIFRWYPKGDSIQVAVSIIDTLSTDSAYIFQGWNFALEDTAIVVLNDNFDAIAEYELAYRALLTKLPAETLGTMTIDGEVYSGANSIRYEDWWIQGSEHTVDVSVADDVSSTQRYGFTRWSDGILSSSRTLIADAPESLSALYWTEYLATVIKNPRQSYGWIAMDGEIFEYSDSASSWVWKDSTVLFEVSGYDIAGLCSVYTFTDWAIGPTDTFVSIEIDSSIVLYANYIGDTIKLDIELNTNIWNIDDTLDQQETRTMLAGEEIVITNNSTFPIRLGLQVTDGGSMTPAYIPGVDEFVLRAVFNDAVEVPEFSSSRDYLKSTLIWATDNVFGAGGIDIPIDDTENLWLQFVAPSSLTAPGDFTITITLWVRATLP
ncbi:hypothetical protein DRQ33_03830, partial [bacterium]